MRPNERFVNSKAFFGRETESLLINGSPIILLHFFIFCFLFSVNVKVKFGIRDDTQVLLMRTFSDSIAIEFD